MALASARPDEPFAHPWIEPEEWLGSERSETYPASQLRALTEDLADLRHQLLAEHSVLPADFEVLRALVAMPDATRDELATSAHVSPAGLLAALDRLHVARLARIRGFSRRAIASMAGESAWWAEHPRGRAPEAAQHRSPEDIRPVATDAGRDLVADVDAQLEAPLVAILGTLPAHERHRLVGVLEACRAQVWEQGSAPVVAVLEP